MTFSQALHSLLALRLFGGRPADTTPASPDTSALAGASFPEQEPELSKELHLTGRDISGWSMGGSSLSD